MSKAGKETLIKAVIQAIPRYATSIFKISFLICRSIEKRIAVFWWKNIEPGAGFIGKDRKFLKQEGCRAYGLQRLNLL